MAESKYDLMLVATNSGKKIYTQPWYKERLKTKYTKSKRPGDTSKFLHANNWKFIKDGLDDFRDGLPPNVDGSVVIEGTKGLGPNITGSNSDNTSAIKQPAVRRRFTQEQICYSRVTPLQQQRRQHIREIEYGLTQHPLALYPHLEECLPPDVFEDIVDVLDPEMNMPSDEEEGSLLEEDEDEAGSSLEDNDEFIMPSDRKFESQVLDNTAAGDTDEDERRVRNPYRWLPKKEEKRDRKKTTSDRRDASPSQDEHIKNVTSDFCNWVTSLGGEKNNIEETTITSLFASGYETKPALSVPIHVVELTNVPPELRTSATVPAQQRDTKNIPSRGGERRGKEEASICGESEGGYTPSWTKYKYGAWYQPPSTWKKRPFDEPLEDPNQLKEQEASESKKKSDALDEDMASMHGSKAFIKFIEDKGARKPDFLSRVADIQATRMREEVERAEAEAQKLHKSSGGTKRR